MEDLIAQGAGVGELREQARRSGFRSLREYGFEKVFEGLTTLDEVISATGDVH